MTVGAHCGSTGHLRTVDERAPARIREGSIGAFPVGRPCSANHDVTLMDGASNALRSRSCDDLGGWSLARPEWLFRQPTENRLSIRSGQLQLSIDRFVPGARFVNANTAHAEARQIHHVRQLDRVLVAKGR
jgi:hypothetical protein